MHTLAPQESPIELWERYLTQPNSPVLSLPQSEGNTDSVLVLTGCPNLAVCSVDSLLPSCLSI